MTTLLLTNRLKFWKIFPYPVNLVLCIYMLLMSGLFLTKCDFAKDQKDIPDVVYKARAFLPITSDTTKPKPRVIYNHYKLEGSDTLFQMLWLQVQSPADVTPRNLQKLRDWLQSSIKIDSTIKQ